MAHAKCSLFAAFNVVRENETKTDSASQLVYYGLHALQHRGQECAGILSQQLPTGLKASGPPTSTVNLKKGFGLVLDVFDDPNVFKQLLRGENAMGHTRYTTSGGSSSPYNIQPMTCTYKLGNLAVAHNGNISNFDRIKAKFVEKGTLFQSSSDTELVLHLIAQSPKTTQIEQILDAMYQLEGAFSLILVTDTAMYAIRDPNGLRPLLLGKMPNQNPQAGSAYFLSSETCAFDLIGAECVREIEPGEILVIKKEHCIEGNFESHRMPPKWGISPCIFEYVYFARPDSRVFGAMVDTVRHECGVQLARESPCPKRGPDDPEIVVVAIPDSSNAAALGFQQECLRMGYPCQFEFGIIRNHYVGRTFITPSQSVRELKVRFKFNMVRRVFEGKIIVLVDDSIVRGTTSRALIRMALKSGAKEVHFRVASPPVVAPCYYGMDFPSKNELIAHHHSNPQSIADWMGAQSLGYLSVEGLQAAVLRCQPSSKDFCKACFTGNYPVPIDGVKNEVLEFVNESTARGPSPIPVIAKKQKTGLSPIPEKIVLPAAIHEAASAAKKAEW